MSTEKIYTDPAAGLLAAAARYLPGSSTWMWSIFVIPGAKMYISLAHSDPDLDVTLAAFDAALAASA